MNRQNVSIQNNSVVFTLDGEHFIFKERKKMKQATTGVRDKTESYHTHHLH
jgi:hypothetical protein